LLPRIRKTNYYPQIAQIRKREVDWRFLTLSIGFCRMQNLQGPESGREPVFDPEFSIDFFKMAANSVMPDTENQADDRTALAGGYPVKDFRFRARRDPARKEHGEHTPNLRD
jgi:hypothetical protein